MVSAAVKYPFEIEIFTFGRGFRTQISRSSVQKRRFNQLMTRPFGRTDFFNRIDRLLPVAKGSKRPGANFALMLELASVRWRLDFYEF